MPARHPKIREPRSIEVAYIKTIRRVWSLAQGIVAQGLAPLLEIWPSEGGRTDADDPYSRSAVTQRIWELTDEELRRLWPGIDPPAVRLYAPWATSRTEVTRIAYPGGRPAHTDLETYVARAIMAERTRSPVTLKEAQQYDLTREPWAFRLRPRTYAPVILGPDGLPMPLPPRVRELSEAAIHRQIQWMDIQISRMISAERLEETIGRTGERVASWTSAELERVLAIDLRDDPQISRYIGIWRKHNVGLIETGVLRREADPRLRPSLLADVERVVDEAHRSGLRVEILAHDLRERFGVSDSRAELIARDQILKLNGQINKQRQMGAGITRYRWVTSRDERVRERHQELDDTIQEWASPPEVAPGRHEHPGGDYQCFDGSTVIRYLPGIAKVYRTRFSGKLTRVVTSSGESMRATENHPCLTGRGWIPVHDLHVGDQVLSVGEKGVCVVGENQQDGVTIGQIFDFFSKMFPIKTMTSPYPQFHGDIRPDEEIDVIDIDWGLMIDWYPSIRQPFDDFFLSLADAATSRSGDRPTPFLAAPVATNGIIGFSRDILSLVNGCVPKSDKVCLRSASNLQTTLDDNSMDWGPRNAECFRDPLHAHPLVVQALHGVVDIVDLVPCDYIGHVFTLESFLGVYTTSAVVANCRCVAVPVMPD